MEGTLPQAQMPRADNLTPTIQSNPSNLKIIDYFNMKMILYPYV